MSKIIRLNDETCRLLEIIRLDLKKEFAKNEMIESMKDILDNDNIVIQSGLRTAIEFNTYLLTSNEFANEIIEKQNEIKSK